MAQDFEAQLEAVKDRIVQNLNPEQIILFGSHAYGTPTADSDVDLLVVMKSNQTHSERIIQVSRLFRPRPFPMDILVKTPEEIAHRVKIGDTFMQEVLRGGRVLYDKRIPG